MATLNLLTYEWDKRKEAFNIKNHGVSFHEVSTVFLDPLSLSFYAWKHYILPFTLPLEKLIGKRYSLDEINQPLDDLEQRKSYQGIDKNDLVAASATWYCN